MPHLRPTALAGLLLAFVPAAATLSSCGFDYPTDRVNTIAGGENNRDHSVDALGIRVLATAKGEGRLIGSLANNNEDQAALESVESPDGSVRAADFEPVQVEGRAGVNLAELAPIALTGTFTAGDVVPLQLVFSTGETASLDVPVVKPCFQYTQVPTAAAEEEGGEAADAAAEEEGEEAHAEETGAHAEESEAHADESEAHAEETDGATDHAEGEAHGEQTGDATYNCADVAPAPEGAH